MPETNYNNIKIGIVGLGLVAEPNLKGYRRRTNPIMVQGAVISGVAIVHQLEPDPLSILKSGDWVRLNPTEGSLELLEELEE
jgi:hypothetical protein